MFIPTGWKCEKLEDICDIKIGKTPNRSIKDFWDSDNLTDNTWLSIADLNFAQNKIVTKSKEQISNKAIKLMQQVPMGTLLLSFKLTIGKVAFAGKNLYTNEAIAQLPIKNNYIDKNYLYYYLYNFNYDTLLNGDIKVKGETLNKEKLKILPVTFPSITEQKRIVSKLDFLFEKIEALKLQTQQSLNSAKELFESELNKSFTENTQSWTEKRLEDVLNFSQGIQVDLEKQYNIKVNNNYHRFLRIIDFTQGTEEPRYITNYPQIAVVYKNDLSMVRYGASTGFVCRGLEGVIANNLFRIIPKYSHMFTNSFLFYFFKSNIFTKNIKKSLQGVAMPSISFKVMNNIKIKIPSLEIQQQIVSKLDDLYKKTTQLQNLYTQKLNYLDELKQSILNKAFKGEL